MLGFKALLDANQAQYVLNLPGPADQHPSLATIASCEEDADQQTQSNAVHARVACDLDD